MTVGHKWIMKLLPNPQMHSAALFRPHPDALTEKPILTVLMTTGISKYSQVYEFLWNINKHAAAES